MKMVFRYLLSCAVVLSLMALSYSYGRRIEYKNALIMEATKQSSVVKMNEHLLMLLDSEKVQEARLILKDSIEVNKLLLELSEGEAKQLETGSE